METVIIDCPNCMQQYTVDKSDLADEVSEFSCTKCNMDFYCSYSESGDEYKTFLEKNEGREIFEVTMTANKEIDKIEYDYECPECGKINDSNLKSCDFCGLVFEKYQKYLESKIFSNNDPTKPNDGHTLETTSSIKNTDKLINKSNIESKQAVQSKENTATESKQAFKSKEITASIEIKNMWDVVIEKYEDLNMHEQFIQLCLTQESLAFASQQYRKILEANPNDEIAKTMKSKIIGLTVATYVPATNVPAKSFRLELSGTIAIIGLIFTIIATLVDEIPGRFIILTIGLLSFIFGTSIRLLKR